MKILRSHSRPHTIGKLIFIFTWAVVSLAFKLADQPRNRIAKEQAENSAKEIVLQPAQKSE